MAWERFIKVIPQGGSVALYRKDAMISLVPYGAFALNRGALAMADADRCEFAELWFNQARKLCGFTFSRGPRKHALRLTPVGDSPARKIACRTFIAMFGLKLPSRAVKMVPRMEGGKIIVDLPPQCVQS